MLDYDAIMNNINTQMQYYTLEIYGLIIKQLVQLYLSQAHEFRVGELIIKKKHIFNYRSYATK